MTATRRPVCPPETHPRRPPGPAAVPTPRTLPLRVQPLPGEALDSWLEALAHRYGVPFGDVLYQCGIASAGPGAWMRLLDPGTLARIAHVADLSADDVDAMALPRDHGTLTRVNRCLARMLPSGPWDWRANSRYCPYCLDSTGGRWKLAWRLNWTFACLTHHCLLVDTCPECLCEQRRNPSPMTHVPCPGQCRGPRRRDPTGALLACVAGLASAHPIDLSAQPRFLEAQQQVTNMLLAATPAARQDLHRTPVAFETLRVLVRWVAKTIDYAQLEPQAVVTSCYPSLAAPYSDSTAENTAAETAAHVATALTILNTRNTAEAAHTWHDLMIAANHGRIHRLTDADRGNLIPRIRLAHSRAYADANAQHKLRRRLSASAVKHQPLRPEPTLGGHPLGNSEQHWFR